MVRRRAILTAIGTACASGAVGTVAGRGRRRVPASEVGLERRVASLLRRGEIETARGLLEESDVAHTIAGGPREPSGGPSIQSSYSGAASSVYCTLVHLEADRWLATGVALLSGREFRLRDAAMVPDACALTYDAAEWTSPDPTRGNLWLTASHHTIRYEVYNPNYGAAATVDLAYNRYPDAVIGMQTELLRRSAHPQVPVKFSYEHTYAWFNDYLDGLGVSVAGGGLTVRLPAGATRAWLHEETAAPG